MDSSWHLHQPHNVLLWEKYPILMMLSSEFFLVIWLDKIIEVQKGVYWVKNSSDNQYPTSTVRLKQWQLFSLIRQYDWSVSLNQNNCKFAKSFSKIFLSYLSYVELRFNNIWLVNKYQSIYPIILLREFFS